jgi:hypothetical protein
MSRKFIFGGSFASAVPLLLDLYPAEVAYSLRQLRADNPNVVRIRRDNDNAESDFKPSDLLDGTAVAWVGLGNTGFATKWYNLGTGGSTYDATQTNASLQQRIINATGAVDLVNTKPCITTEHTTSRPPFNIGSDVTFKTFLSVNRIQSQNTLNYLVFKESILNGIHAGGSFIANSNIGAFDGTNFPSINDGFSTNQRLLWASMRSSKVFFARNGGTETDMGTFAASLTINEVAGRKISTNLYMRGQSQEWIFWNSDQSANLAAIRDNVNAYYGIY